MINIHGKWLVVLQDYNSVLYNETVMFNSHQSDTMQQYNLKQHNSCSFWLPCCCLLNIKWLLGDIMQIQWCNMHIIAQQCNVTFSSIIIFKEKLKKTIFNKIIKTFQLFSCKIISINNFYCIRIYLRTQWLRKYKIQANFSYTNKLLS